MKVLKMAAVCAVVALGVGAASATAASLVTSKNIKNGTIQMVDMSASAKRALKGNTGAPGAPGSVGANGANGAQGPAGGFDPAKVKYIEGPTVTVAPGDPGISIAWCPAGTKVVGGGQFFALANGGLTVESSQPRPQGDGWIAGFSNTGSVDGEATAYAVCAAK